MIVEEFKVKNSAICYVIRCDTCSAEFNRHKANYLRSKNPDTCRACARPKRDRRGHCIYCSKETSIGSKRCKSCSQIVDKSNYKTITGLAYTPLSYCCDCNIVLKKCESKRCPDCHNKNQDKGKSSERIKFNASKPWKRIRNMVFERDDYTCDSCKRRGSTQINAHHKLSFTHFKDYRLDPDNLITLCIDCHKQVHFGDDIDMKLKYIEDYFYL